MISTQDQERLETARNLWLATVRPNGAPHLVPIWFVWLNDKAYLCTARDSVKGRNIAADGRIVFALEDGDDPVVMEGQAVFMADLPPELVDAFQKKFNWNIVGDSTYNKVVEITPTRVVL